ncbi:MAG TPA: 3-deoxy-manno-octulosonate cytidylyltransferase [Chitinophagales bacterium]|nr:3-deoxy-manno-octulosonate cytidylyltransferase [Chitinophagales bacterium]
MKITGIIPARYASSRFPGKPLTLIDGRPMIQHVYEQCLQSKYLSDVIIATDDERIAEAIRQFGGEYMMTSSSHPSGTDRCAEVCSRIETDAVINIQGDEPRIHPEQIDQVARLLLNRSPICTLARRINSEAAQDSNIVKLVKTLQGKALYFSRYAIPFHSTNEYLQHIGIYGYQKDILLEIAQLEPTFLELSEKLEQLRWLENGYDIFVDITTHENISIDRPEDLHKLIS